MLACLVGVRAAILTEFNGRCKLRFDCVDLVNLYDLMMFVTSKDWNIDVVSSSDW